MNVPNFLFAIIENEKLEGKVWFRGLRVLNVVAFILIILIACFFIWLGWETRTPISATVRCKDGTEWSAIKDGRELDSSELCGICTRRSSDDKTYKECSYDNPNYFNSYEIVDIQPDIAGILFPVIAFVVFAFAILKAVILSIIYIIAGYI